MIEAYPWNTQDCFHCPAWTGTGCSLTACCRTHISIYIDGELIELGSLNQND